MNELLQYVQQLMEYIEQNSQRLNAATQRELAIFLQEVWQFIEEYNARQGTGNLQPVPEIPPSGPSSNIAGTQYDPKTQNLLVQFLGKYPDRNGPIYQYPDTPAAIAEMVQKGMIPARTKGQNAWGKWFPGKSPSRGSSVNTLLRERGVPYQRLS